MKTYCVVMPDNTSYTIRAQRVFEVDELSLNTERAIKDACSNKRPYSGLRTKLTFNESRLPVVVAGQSFTRVQQREDGL